MHRSTIHLVQIPYLAVLAIVLLFKQEPIFAGVAAIMTGLNIFGYLLVKEESVAEENCRLYAAAFLSIVAIGIFYATSHHWGQMKVVTGWLLISSGLGILTVALYYARGYTEDLAQRLQMERSAEPGPA